mgnify:CR=1 FL=1
MKRYKYDNYQKKRKAAALEISGDGRAWWIYQYIMSQNVPVATSALGKRLRRS